MWKLNICFLLIILGFEARIDLYAQKKYTADPKAASENIYKHYTGTIGNRKVTLDLRWGYQGGSNYGGSYFYYNDEGGIRRFYIFEPKTYNHDETLTAREEGEYDLTTGEEDRKGGARWVFNINQRELSGKWYSGDGKDIRDIKLTEDLSHSYGFDLMPYSDFARRNTSLRSGKNFAFVVRPVKQLMASGKHNNEEAKFIDEKLLQFLSDKNVDGNQSASLLPVYNTNDILVLKNDGFINREANIAYLCLDVKNKKQLVSGDILIETGDRLKSLIEQSLRKQYKLDQRKKLSTWLKVDEMPLTNNVMPANGGLIFSYAPREILPAEKAEAMYSPIDIFVSYQELDGLLTAAFKKRVGI